MGYNFLGGVDVAKQKGTILKGTNSLFKRAKDTME